MNFYVWNDGLSCSNEINSEAVPQRKTETNWRPQKSGLNAQCVGYTAKAGQNTEDWNAHPSRGRVAAFYLKFWKCSLQCLRLLSAKCASST